MRNRCNSAQLKRQHYATIGGKTFWQLREMTRANSCGDDLRAHFGLGDATVVDRLVIEWPSGTRQELTEVAVKQTLQITEPRRPLLAIGSEKGAVYVLKCES